MLKKCHLNMCASTLSEPFFTGKDPHTVSAGVGFLQRCALQQRGYKAALAARVAPLRTAFSVRAALLLRPARLLVLLLTSAVIRLVHIH